MSATRAYAVTSIVQLPKVGGVRVSTIETEDTPEACKKAHALSVAVANPKARGADGLVIGIERRPDLEAWAADTVRSALVRAKRDSRTPLSQGLPLSFKELPNHPGFGTWTTENAPPVPSFTCLGCFTEHVFSGDGFQARISLCRHGILAVRRVKLMAEEWREKAKILGPAHPKGAVCVLVSERAKGEYSFAPGFMNGTTFRPQRFLPGDRIEEILDVLDEAAAKYPRKE